MGKGRSLPCNATSGEREATAGDKSWETQSQKDGWE